MSDMLSHAEVTHVARLARLHLTDAQIDQYRAQLSSILVHIAKLNELDVSDVEPLAHPLEMANRLDDDEPEPPMAIEDLLRNAPAVEGRFLSVPKVLGDGGGA